MYMLIYSESDTWCLGLCQLRLSPYLALNLRFSPTTKCCVCPGLSQEVEEVHRQRVSREREVPRRVEEQELPAETVHDESSKTRPDDLRSHVCVVPSSFPPISLITILFSPYHNLCVSPYLTHETMYIHTLTFHTVYHCDVMWPPGCLWLRSWATSTSKSATLHSRSPTRRLGRALRCSLSSALELILSRMWRHWGTSWASRSTTRTSTTFLSGRDRRLWPRMLWTWPPRKVTGSSFRY